MLFHLSLKFNLKFGVERFIPLRVEIIYEYLDFLLRRNYYAKKSYAS
nr:MAG TPA: hypothetical protein [Caudoviricetes sp.]